MASEQTQAERKSAKNAPVEPVKALFAVTARGNGRKWIDRMRSSGIFVNLQLSARGTASSDMMDILGLDDLHKDTVLSIGTAAAVDRLAEAMGDSTRRFQPLRGIMLIFPLSAVNYLIAAASERHFGEALRNGKISGGVPEHSDNDNDEDEMKEKKENTEKMDGNAKSKSQGKSDYNYGLILIAVNHGHSDAVMETAKKAGATGGTVLRGRLADADRGERFIGIKLEEEREIVAIMAPGSTRGAIIEAVNRDEGLRTDAQAVICSFAAEKAFMI